jgi:hypothetical protein
MNQDRTALPRLACGLLMLGEVCSFGQTPVLYITFFIAVPVVTEIYRRVIPLRYLLATFSLPLLPFGNDKPIVRLRWSGCNNNTQSFGETQMQGAQLR